jgi:cytochrome c-type biogenesis protein CcmH/NrfG
MFLLFKKHGLLPGILAASLVGCSPYVLLDVYVRVAYPELSAFALQANRCWRARRSGDADQEALIPQESRAPGWTRGVTVCRSSATVLATASALRASRC